MVVTAVLEVILTKVFMAVKVSWGVSRRSKKSLKALDLPALINLENIKALTNNYDSWSKAKMRLTADEFNKLHRTNDCINCDEAGHKLFESPKPKPLLLESVVDFAMPITRTLISDLPSNIE